MRTAASTKKQRTTKPHLTNELKTNEIIPFQLFLAEGMHAFGKGLKLWNRQV